MVYVLRTGIIWNAFPREKFEGLGSSALHARFQQWEEAIHFYERRLAVEYSEKGAEFLTRCQKKLAEKNAPSKRWWQVWK
jgi:hypothetical protein